MMANLQKIQSGNPAAPHSPELGRQPGNHQRQQAAGAQATTMLDAASGIL